MTVSTGCRGTAKDVRGPEAKGGAEGAESAFEESGDRKECDGIVVFLTGSELGTLKPCGCSGGQLGGLDRRWAIFNSVSATERLIVDTGGFVDGNSEQDLIKFNIIIEAFGLLGYDLVNLRENDAEIAESQDLLEGISSLLNIISSQTVLGGSVPHKFTKQFSVRGESVAVTVTAFDAEIGEVERVGELFGGASNAESVNILILNEFDAVTVSSIAKMGIVDCVLCLAESDEPTLKSEPGERPLVITDGRFGKYVGRLEIKRDGVGDKLRLGFSSQPVTEDLPANESLVELYKGYQELVKEADLLEQYPRFVLPDGLEYTGSKSCKLCHEYEYGKWGEKAHSRAYATLERVGSQYDPECVVCHVVGMEYISGFVSEDKTGRLKNVGCENCHGPGSEHIRMLGKALTREPKSDCEDCHTPDHSAEYPGNEDVYFEKIIHWREPNAVRSVEE
jgi:hypothetical protein